MCLRSGRYRSLDETRAAYYERYRFADVFALVRRAPKTLVDQIAEIPGVAAVDARIAKLALLDIPELPRARHRAIHFAARHRRARAQPALHAGWAACPSPGRAEEVVVNESFANAHAFVPGSRFSAILNGRKRELVIVGIALSPEFIYAIGPGRHHAG